MLWYRAVCGRTLLLGCCLLTGCGQGMAAPEDSADSAAQLPRASQSPALQMESLVPHEPLSRAPQIETAPQVEPVPQTAIALPGGLPASPAITGPQLFPSRSTTGDDTPAQEQPVAEQRESGPLGTTMPELQSALKMLANSDLVTSAVADAPASGEHLSSGPLSGEAHSVAGAYGKKPPVDPVKLNGPIFEEWPKPAAALIITGEQMGYIEPCGCAGLENQKGGLSRRHSLIKQMQEWGWPLAAIDLGETNRRFGQQAEIKYQLAIDALKTMGYGVIGWGPSDLRLPAGTLVLSATESDGSPSRFVSANVGLFGFDSGMSVRSRVVPAGNRKIGVTAVLADSHRQTLKDEEDLTIRPAAEALAEVVPGLKAASDFRVLLCYGSPEESAALAKRFPEFDVVVTAGGADEPPPEARRVPDSRTLLVEVGHKGMFAIVLGLYDDEQTPVRYQRVPLDSRFPDSPEMKAVMASYQQQLQALGWEGLGIRSKLHPKAAGPGDEAARFVGSAKCGECHSKAFAVWEKTPHAHATETLVKLSPQRHFDAECISCHATGWHPQQYYPFENGYVDLTKTAHLAGNGCENCHGPGGKHVAIESGDISGSDELVEQLRASMRVARGTALNNACAQCHDLDNSPEFDLDKYWPLVEHKGKD